MTRLLLDPQIFLWAVADSRRLQSTARAILRDADEVYVSAASIWEIAIKSALGKLEADSREMVEALAASGFTELPVTAVHAAGMLSLPRHQADPFDRLLLAQALAEPLRLLTADRMLPRYSDLVVLV